MQLQKTTEDSVIFPVTSRVGYAQPSLGVLSCHTCNIRGGCLIKELSTAQEYAHQVLKNRMDVAKGYHLFRGGDVTKSIYIVTSGSVKSYVVMENGEEQVLDFYLPGDVFGLDAMGSDSHISSAVALEMTRVCKFPLSDLYDRTLGQGFLNLISDNLRRDHNLILMLARKDADARLASFLVDMSKRIENNGHIDGVIKLAMTRQDIANYLGLAVETVCRALRRFQDSGMLEVTRRKVKVHDFNCLLTIAGTQITD